MAEGQYSKLYHVLMDEYPNVWKSDAQLALFVRLLVIADKWWPQWAPIGARNGAYQSLVKSGLVIENKESFGYTILGLDKARSARSKHGKHAAGIRWGNAPSNAEAMPSRTEQSKAEYISAQSTNGTPLFMGYKPKPGEHLGQHPDCVVCQSMRKPA